MATANVKKAGDALEDTTSKANKLTDAAKPLRAVLSEADRTAASLKNVSASSRDTTTSAALLNTALGNLSSAGGPVGDLVGKFADLKDGADGIAQGVRGLAQALGGITSAGAALSVVFGAVVGIAAVSYAPVIDELSDMADKFGITATEALVLDKALRDSGSSADEYFSILNKVQSALSATGDAGSKQSEAFRKLGVTFTETTKVSDVMTQAADAYNTKQREGTLTTADAAAAQQIFGENIQGSLSAIAAAGVAEQELAELRKQGIGITEQGTKAAGDLETAQRGFGTVMTSIGSALVGEIVPSFTALITAMTNSYTHGGMLKTAMDFLRIALQVVLVPIRVLVDAFIGLDTIVQITAATMIATWEAIEARSTAPFAKLKTKIDGIVASQAELIRQNKWLQTDDGKLAAPSGSTSPSVGTTTPGKDEITPLLERANALLTMQLDIKAKLNGEDDTAIKLAREFDMLIAKMVEKGGRQKANLIATIKQRALSIETEIRSAKIEEDKKKVLAESKTLLEDITAKNAELRGQEDTRSKIGEQFNKLIEQAVDLKNGELVKELQIQKAKAISLELQNKAIIQSEKQIELLAEQAAREREQQAMAYRWLQQVKATEFTSLVAKSVKSPEQQAEDTLAATRAGINSEAGAKSDALIAKANSLRASPGAKPSDIEEANRLEAEANALLAKAAAAVGELTKNLNEAKASSNDVWAGMTAGMENFTNSIPTLNQAMASFTSNTLNDFTNRLTDLFTTGKFGFKDFVKTAIAELIKLQMQMMMMKMVTGASAAAGGGGLSAFFSSFMGKADGGAFNRGVQFYANGGVFGSPTMFQHAGGLGVLGEAGPEAVMPLRRGSDGKLGIAMVGGTSGSVQVNNNISVVVQGGKTNTETGNAVAEAVVRKIADQRIYDATRSGGIIRKAMTGA